MIFDNVKEAKDYSHAEAVRRGCKGSTIYWWPIRKHPTENKWAVNENNLSEDWYEQK